MAQAVEGIGSELAQLYERLRELERRVAALEGGAEEPNPNEGQFVGAPLQRPRPPATWRGFPPADVPAGAVPVVGKAVLGIAGAYLLRAIAESSAVPKLPVLLAAIVYAGLWMFWAVRSHSSNRFASGTYAATSALILSPLLWESTVRFQTLSPIFSAGVLVAFVVLALALGWKRGLQLVPWVATLAALATAIALIIATRDLVPLTAAVLAVAVTTEIAACVGHRLSLRGFPALAADFGVWLLVYVLAAAEVPEGYRPASAAAITMLCLTLLAIYGGSIAVRSFGFRHRLSIFEVVQVVAAFVLATYGTMRATRGAASQALGIAFLVFAAVCYWGALSRFSADEYGRNRRVTATWAAALLLGGSFLLLPANWQIPFLCVASVIAAWVYARTKKLSLGLHASFFLLAAAAVSPLPAYCGNALAGSVPAAPAWEVWLAAASALLCYAIGSRAQEDRAKRRLLWVVPAALASFAAAAVMVVSIARAAARGAELEASRLSVVRTVVICALALALGYLGARWKRLELGWVAYAVVVFGTLKLLFEDLRFGNAASLVVSLLFYGLVLILLPRLSRQRTEP